MAYCAYCGSHVAQVSYVPCASCGKPTNGAPPAPAKAAGGTNPAVIVIAVVGAAFVILMIIGILAAIAIPNLLTAMQRSKQKRTMADIRTIAVAVEAYAEDNRKYPEAQNVAELVPLLEPEYVSNLPTHDGWTHELRYRPLPEGYAIGSAGNDGKFDRDLTQYSEPIATRNFDCDIVFANGAFLQYPELSSGGGQ